MEAKILRLLIVDDSPDEAELALTALRKGGFLLKPQRVNDIAGLQAAIDKGGWDAVISERTLPHFGANVVLDAMKQAHADTPILILTRTIPDSEMVALMRAGARDVILKNQLARLLPALERELAVAAERAEHRAAARALKEVQDKHRAVVESAREAVCYSQDGMHIDANNAYLDMFEYESMTELEGVPVMNLIDKSEHGRFKQFIRKVETKSAPQEFTGIRKDGTRFSVEITVSPITMNGETCTQLLVTDISARKAVETKLQYLNQHDPLTGLYNRQHFLQELEQLLAQTKRDGNSHGLVYIDFHDLREVARTLGHAAADRYLLDATRRAREIFGEAARIARYGDHEFAACLPGASSLTLRDAVTRAQTAFRDGPLSESGTPIKCDFRIASSLIDRTSEGAPQIMAKLVSSGTAAKPPTAPAAVPPSAAPASPAAASASKPNPTSKTPAALTSGTPPKIPERAPAAHGAKPAARAPAAPPIDWKSRIQAALERESFRLIYQPIVNLHGEAAEYFEVLVRLVGEDGKLVPAGLFMSTAAQTGQSVAIDRWVVRQSIRALAELHRQQRKVRFFVNLSAAALQDVELIVIAQHALHETGLKGKYVTFEIDETDIAKHSEPAMAFMRAAAKIGANICIDNFGQTLAVSNRLREPMVQYLKLHPSLVQNLTGDAVTQASLRAVVDVAKAMEKHTIAKGVEAAEALSVLWTLGIDYVQGHYIQEADADLNYEFGAETEISSDDASPQWAVANRTKTH